MKKMKNTPGSADTDPNKPSAARSPRPELAPLEGEAQIQAAASSQLYALFAHAMSYPDDQFCDWIREGGIVEPMREGLPLAVPKPGAADVIDWDALLQPGAGDDLAIEYTRLFDTGASGPPCPLYGGLYGDARMKKMEEAVRFYNHFGLTLSEEQRELPDHLVTQLEFLHYLAYCEVEALQQGADPGAFRRARRDFIERHPGRWVPELCQRLARAEAAPFFIALLGAVETFLAADRSLLADA